MRRRLENLVNEMLDGQILLAEALFEFEKVFIEKALERNRNHISNTAARLGMHRNTVAKRIAAYNGSSRKISGTAKPARRPRRS